MNVFDFDNTIFDGDSTVRFFLFAAKKHPKTLCWLPKIAVYSIRYYTLHIGTKTQFKEKMYSFLKSCDTERDVELFWDNNIDRIKSFYRDISRDDDVIISASPEFLLKPLEKRLNVTVIASRVSPEDGLTTGENCYNEEKVRRFREAYPDSEIDCFYSDSYADEPLAKIAKKAYIVHGESVEPWDKNKHKKRLRT